ncbi:MAG: hypothetical protein HY909_24690 [Deltaproteobacteria bacterium]|nr:hypothetical protein [Deltaproteobacteria bacterium]
MRAGARVVHTVGVVDEYVASWFRAFLWTTALEVPVAAWLLRDGDAALPRRVARVSLASVLTHPAVWFVFPFLGLSYRAQVAASELWAVLAELVFYRLMFWELGWRRCAQASLLANALSFLTGLGLQRWGALG